MKKLIEDGGSEFDSTQFGDTIDDMISYLQSEKEKNPNVKIISIDNNEGSFLFFQYYRLETDDEYAARLNKEKMNDDQRRKLERRLAGLPSFEMTNASK